MKSRPSRVYCAALGGGANAFLDDLLAQVAGESRGIRGFLHRFAVAAGLICWRKVISIYG
jgi:hypothetical protein